MFVFFQHTVLICRKTQGELLLKNPKDETELK